MTSRTRGEYYVVDEGYVPGRTTYDALDHLFSETSLARIAAEGEVHYFMPDRTAIALRRGGSKHGDARIDFSTPKAQLPRWIDDVLSTVGSIVVGSKPTHYRTTIEEELLKIKGEA